jgi:purine nucleoside permease
MADADRMQAIGRIQTDTQGQLATMQQMDNNLSILAMKRLKERGDINTIKSLYGLPN